MTEDSTDDFEARVRRDLAAIAENVPAGTFEREGDVPASMRGRERRRLVAAAVVVIVAAVGLVTWASSVGNESGVDVSESPSTQNTSPPTAPTEAVTDSPDEAPPPSESEDYRIWMSQTEIPVRGADVAFAVVGPPGGSGVWGSVFGVEQWNGEAWESEAAATMCAFPCAADLDFSGEPIIVGMVGHTVGESGVSTAQGVNLRRLDPGWYRLRVGVDSTIADAVFRVLETDRALDPPPWPEDEQPRLVPGLSNVSGGTLQIDLGIVPEPNWAYEKPPVVERWVRTKWVGLMSVDTNAAGSALVLPALPAGAYRLAVEGGGDLRFWVAEDIPGALPCHTTVDLAELLGSDAAPFEGPHPPTVEMRSSFDRGGFRAEWTGAEQAIRYSYPVGFVRDLAGDRVVREGPVMLRYLGGFDDTPSTIEAWVELPGCGDLDAVTAGFEVSGGSEQENVSLALRLGRALAETYNPDWAPAVRTTCPGPDSPEPDTPNEVHMVWMYCRTSLDEQPELVPVKTIFSPDAPMAPAVVRRAVSDPWNGLESAVPVELRGAPVTVDLVEGVLSITWEWNPELTVGPPLWEAADPRILDQIAATAFGFADVDAIEVPLLWPDHEPFTRADWDQWKVANDL